ncbi:cache domain-containing sensor histidine kinase [Vallitalea guaymasensis]|uniref:sensor histidine kinase n=1 Tax=Vallitalea guaymasensis TaxID=1185412 RepID=UPI000DE52D66|nr:sensor histidine kinase [Vallitalea guaymasensis]
MNPIKELYYGRSVREKILINFIIVIAITVVILSTIFIRIFIVSFEDSTNNHTYQMIKQVNNNIEYYIHNMENIIYYLSQDKEVRHFLMTSIDSTEKNDIHDLIAIYEETNNEIGGIMIVNNNDAYISNNMERASREPLALEDWYQQAYNNKMNIQLISNPIGRNIIYKNENFSADDVVSVSKAILDHNKNIIGVILIDLKLEAFKEAIASNVIGKSGFIYVVDAHGNIVYTPVNNVVYRIRPSWINKNKNSFIKTIMGIKYQIIWNESTYTNWKVIGVFSLKDILANISHIKFIVLLVAIGMLIIAIIITIYLADSLTKPIGKLKRLMNRAEEGELEIRFESKYNDEIGKLGNSFNNMIEAIKNLINLVYVEQQKKKEAELEILRAQIKPHFLYNTLDTIHWLAVEKDNEGVIKLLKALTKLFRISLSKGKDFITLKEEINHVESYLIIQMTRYEDKFDYDIVCDESILHTRIIKLILQPIVENAIYHGIKEKRGKGFIEIFIRKKNQMIEIVIEDNGAGIEQKEVIHINKILRGEIGRTNEYGLVNVNEKIKLTYGNAYGVQLSSQIGEGTKVIIYHPYIEE